MVLAIAANLSSSTAVAKNNSDPKAIIAADPAAGKLIDLPFIAQKRFDCGPTSVAMVLRHHGVDADPDAIAKKFETEKVAGTFTIDLLIAAGNAGMDAHWITGDLQKLRDEIDHGRPAIVFLNLAINPLPQRHFAVAIGYLTHKGKDYVVLHSGGAPNLMVPVKKFSRQWKRTGHMTLTVAPFEKNQTPPAPKSK